MLLLLSLLASAGLAQAGMPWNVLTSPAPNMVAIDDFVMACQPLAFTM